MPSDFGDESGEKLFDWMLRIGQDASEAALLTSAERLKGAFKNARGEVSRAAEGIEEGEEQAQWAKLRMAEFEALPEYETIKEAIDSKLAEPVEPPLSDGFCQLRDGGFVHRVDGVSRVVFDSGQVYLEYGVALARARCIVQKPRYGESLRYVFSRGHGAPPRRERRNRVQGGS